MRQKQINTNSNFIRINYPSTDYSLLNRMIREYIDFQTSGFKNLTLDKVKTNYYLIIDYKEYGYKDIISYVFFLETYILSMLKDGTAPTVDNFKNIVFSNNGLIIYFERYQIAPYYFGEIALTYPMRQG